MKTRSYGILFMLLLCSSIVWSQNTDGHKKNVNYKKHPHWIEMMDDPNVNYHEALKAFNEFWKNRAKPEEEEGQNENEVKRSFLKRIFKSEEKEKEESMEYIIPYKRFNQWKRDVEPFVQADGSILSKEEQMKIWENARK